VAETLSAGDRIGSYEVVGCLGRGGMGVVYEARDTRLGRTVALKVLHSDDPELLRRLDREARAASALNHPNIVQIYDVGMAARQAGEHYVVMEYVEGETLRQRLAAGPLPIPELLDLAAQLTDGLAKAHRAGIVHRDLKPENLVINRDGLLKILDFGLAKVLPAPLADLEGKETLTRHGTQAGMLLGTLEYMSPEQASGRPVDSRTDQFAVGLILSEMATGRAVFHRDTPAQVLAAVIERDPEPLRRQRADAPEALEAVVSRCLRKDPASRFASTDELAAELAKLAGRSRAGSLADARPLTPSAQAGQPPPVPRQAAEPVLYNVQTSDEKVERFDEDELASRIRSGKLTGVELVRRSDEDRWQPLFDSHVFRREVPSVGDPRDAARRRLLRALGGHLMGFAITAIVMYGTQGHFPFWLGIWGVVLAAQAIGTLPQAWPVLFRRGAGEPRVGGVVVVPPPALPAPAAPAAAESPLVREAARVRELIQQRGGKDAPRLLDEVEAIVNREAALAALQSDLEEQTSPGERAALESAVSDARASLERASQEQDRRLFERQLDVLRRREQAIAKAMRVLKRLSVRRELAGHQLKQLRLDLSRGRAVGLDVPELSSRLEYIRHEVDAREEVEEIDAATD
jgi:serine/threonine protein kinase